MKTGVIYSERYLEHDLGPGHPETPDRLKSILKALENSKSLRGRLNFIDPDPATREEIGLAHDESYVKEIERLSESGQMVDLDTPINQKTFELALLSAGGTIDEAQGINDKNIDNGFALVRPPGHHATRNSGGGFCYYNNIAIASRKLLEGKDADRVMIFDFDAHHGNGTQDIFYSDNNVLYHSFHQDGHTIYPGTGFPEEVGEGEGEGYTANVPMPPGSSDKNYVSALREFFIPLSEQFNPDLIMVSAGFDPHKRDPLTHLRLSTQGFGYLAGIAVEQARKLCDGKIGFVLEGGYAINESAKSALEIFKQLVGDAPPELPPGEEASSFGEVKEALSPYWDL